jgi:8-oxo-dGTP pyrophosphatase MutT (NUDIX family)
VLLIDPQQRVLMLAAKDPADGRVIWFVPGGGREPNESLEETARRELAEEVGLLDPPPLEGPIWTRKHKFTWSGRAFAQHETFFVCHLAEPLPIDTIHHDGPEGESFAGARWCRADEIATLKDIVAPRRMAELLEPILAGRLPSQPIDVGA